MQQQRTPSTEIRGTYQRTVFNGDAGFVIGILRDGSCVKGNAPADGFFSPNADYRFFGSYEPKGRFNSHTGKTDPPAFKFTLATPAEPRGKSAIVGYLKRHCEGVGFAVANLLYDAFGEDAVSTLRLSPKESSAKVNDLAKRLVLTEEKAIAAASVLKSKIALEETLIEMESLFAGRGLGQSCRDAAIRKWGALAPLRIRRDPFCLLLAEMPGAGFLRCDKLYGDLGLPMFRRRRQMVCLWHAIRESGSGSTWFSNDWAKAKLNEAIGGTKPSLERALRFGERVGWLTTLVDAVGKRWIADATKAENEKVAAEKLVALMSWKMPETCGPVTLNELRAYGLRGGFTETVNAITDNVSGDDEIDVDEKLRIGRSTDVCQFCGRLLLNPISIAIGCGPVCAERYQIPWGEELIFQEQSDEV